MNKEIQKPLVTPEQPVVTKNKGKDPLSLQWLCITSMWIAFFAILAVEKLTPKIGGSTFSSSSPFVIWNLWASCTLTLVIQILSVMLMGLLLGKSVDWRKVIPLCIGSSIGAVLVVYLGIKIVIKAMY